MAIGRWSRRLRDEVSRLEHSVAARTASYLFSHGLFMFLPQVLGSAALFVAFVVLARVLPQESYGQFVLTRSWMQFLASLLPIGLALASNKFLPKYQHENDLALTRGFVWFALATTAAIGLLTIPLIYLFPQGQRIFPDGLFRFLAPVATTGIAIMILLSSVDRATVASRLAYFPRFLVVPVVFLILIGVAGALSVDQALALFTLSVVAGVILQLATLSFTRGGYVLFGPVRFDVRVWVAASVPILLIGVANDLLRQADMLVLGLIAPKDEVALYQAANVLANFLGLVFGSVHAVVLPKVSKALAKGDNAEAERSIGLASGISLSVTLCGAAVLWLSGSTLLQLFGTEYVRGARTLNILVGAQVMIAALGMSLSVLFVSNFERLALTVVALSAVGHVALIGVLYMWMGIEGAALACLLSIAASYLACTHIARTRLGVETTAVVLLKWIKRS